ncbi:hypothetical protein IQ266_13220 [filamentous cyanobacterium LEGE 11480]|uniref:Uncharacterized protein n=1 Tax=Romeriopsis navalis LEGE 11480 TaxID=2777977 RepID=A0A928Z457_9CYAN|nr:hypothetical protein [Romeriopsis navalis]MBE9030692.1 hypothetical protein [Romeriopsis navalis LEGE 11480]
MSLAFDLETYQWTAAETSILEAFRKEFGLGLENMQPVFQDRDFYVLHKCLHNSKWQYWNFYVFLEPNIQPRRVKEWFQSRYVDDQYDFGNTIRYMADSVVIAITGHLSAKSEPKTLTMPNIIEQQCAVYQTQEHRWTSRQRVLWQALLKQFNCTIDAMQVASISESEIILQLLAYPTDDGLSDFFLLIAPGLEVEDAVFRLKTHCPNYPQELSNCVEFADEDTVLFRVDVA